MILVKVTKKTGKSATTLIAAAVASARHLRQRYAEVHGIVPTLHAAAGQAAMGPATQDAATRQRALEIGLEMMRREAEFRAAQDGLIAASKHVPEELGAGLGEFFSIQRTHYLVAETGVFAGSVSQSAASAASNARRIRAASSRQSRATGSIMYAQRSVAPCPTEEPGRETPSQTMRLRGFASSDVR